MWEPESPFPEEEPHQDPDAQPQHGHREAQARHGPSRVVGSKNNKSSDQIQHNIPFKLRNTIPQFSIYCKPDGPGFGTMPH
jgi:hypothetical protein